MGGAGGQDATRVEDGVYTALGQMMSWLSCFLDLGLNMVTAATGWFILDLLYSELRAHEPPGHGTSDTLGRRDPKRIHCSASAERPATGMLLG